METSVLTATTLAPRLETQELCLTNLPSSREPSWRRRLRIVTWVTIAFGIFFATLGWVLPTQNPYLTRLSFGVLTTILGLMVSVSGLWFTTILNRIQHRRLTSARLIPDGVQATLADGTDLIARWADPTFAIDIVDVPVSLDRPQPTFGLQWPMERNVYSGNLSAAGRESLLREAAIHGISVVEKVVGKGPGAWKTLRLRARLHRA